MSRAPVPTSQEPRGSRRAAPGTKTRASRSKRDTELVEAELARSQARLIHVIDSVTDAIIATHVDGRILLFNAAAERTFGCPAADAIGEPLSRFVPLRILDGSLEDGAFRGIQARRADGEAFPAEAAVTRIEVAGDHLCTVILRDVTRHVRTEEALRRLNDRLEEQTRRIAQALHDEAGQFLTAAHIALVEVAHDLPPATAERLQKVREHLDHVEDQLRRVARELHPRILDDLGLTMALRFLALGFEKRRGVTIVVDADLPVGLRPAVEIAIYRLVQEALSNACKHARARRIRIHLEHASGALRCSITDDGVGFDVASLTARMAAGEGGMGLSGIRDRIEGLGGAMQIDSAPGRGTQLSFTIPEEPCHATAPYSRG
jgi:two-component system sensor kinase